MKRIKLATGTAIILMAMTPTAFAGNIGGMRTERTGNIGGVRIKSEQTATGNIGGLRTEDLSFDISITIRGNIAGLFTRLFSRTF